jgi:fructose-bisphosphate aldolase, class I
MRIDEQLEQTIAAMVVSGKGILAADESQPTIEKRLRAISVASTEENRRAYRQLLVSTPGLGRYISGVILFEETLSQRSDDGVPLPELLARAGVVPGIKVDKGTVKLAASGDDKITEGLDGLAQRLTAYKQSGARFAKWRDTYAIDAVRPSWRAIEANAVVLARYASICQAEGVVPIVEPEVLMDGDHSLERCAQVTEAVQHAVFEALYRYGVRLEYMLLKPNMVLPGSGHPKATSEAIGAATIAVLRRTVPAAVPSINFLSGGQTPDEATANLRAVRAAGRGCPWLLSFSYGRALQQPVLEAWRGTASAVPKAQEALLQLAKRNADAIA